MSLRRCILSFLFVIAVKQVSGLRLVPSESLAELPLKACASEDDLDCIEYDDVMSDFDEEFVRRTLGSKLSTNEPNATKRSKPVMWIHIHKNAGSTVCALAHFNGEKIISPHHNCNWNKHDQAAQTNKHVFTSCAARRKAFADQGATWGQIEREIHDDDFCEGFEYGIMLRDPLEHSISATVDMKLNLKKELKCLRAGTCKGKDFHAYDNFMIRRMLGETGMHIKPGNVTQEHANRVIEMLEKFDTVALLSNFGDTLAAKLGWQQTDWHANRGKSTGNPMSVEDLQFIYANTMMDRTVFEHFGGPKNNPPTEVQ